MANDRTNTTALAQEKVASRTGMLAQAEALERAVNTTAAATYMAQLNSVVLALFVGSYTMASYYLSTLC